MALEKQTNIYFMAADGDDIKGEGTIDNPYQSFTRVRDEIRKKLNMVKILILLFI